MNVRNANHVHSSVSTCSNTYVNMHVENSAHVNIRPIFLMISCLIYTNTHKSVQKVPDVYKVAYMAYRVLLIHVSTLLNELLHLVKTLSTLYNISVGTDKTKQHGVPHADT